jgi:hypothetical protein
MIKSYIGIRIPKGNTPLLTEVNKHINVYAFCEKPKSCRRKDHASLSGDVELSPALANGFKNFTVSYCIPIKDLVPEKPKAEPKITGSYFAPSSARCEFCRLILISDECPRCDSLF